MAEKNSLLIVDDDTSNLMELIHILQQEYKIYTAKDGVSAIKKAEKSLPDLILLDIIMPDMSGFEVLAELKQSEATKMIPVIFITGLSKSDSESKGLALGAVDYIGKPFDDIVVKLRVHHQIQIINLQRELHAAVEAAQAANRSKSAFLANMSHEIRTPMNVIVGLTELLMEDDVPHDEAKEYLSKIDTAGNTLVGLINDVLDISKIEAGKFELTPTRYEPASLLNDIITINSIRIDDKPIVFKLNIGDNMYSELHGDDLRIKQILNNLLSNAFKYTREGTVTLSADCIRKNENEVALSVSISDTGIGLRPESLEKIFAVYNQVDTLANRNIEGTGLGLSITKGLIDLMGGEISVESEYGVGTTFHVSISQGFLSEELFSTETSEALRSFRYVDKNKESTRKLVRPDLSQYRILVVDDFKPNLDVAKGIFGKYKMKVDCVTSGQEALDLIESGEPYYSAVFMDHMMPGMDGIETTLHIRSIDSDYARALPVIALTANAIAGNEQLFMANGFQGFLSKPINLIKLDAVVRQWIMEGNEDAPAPENEAADPPDSPDPPPPPAEDKKIEIPGINSRFGLSLYEDDREMFLFIMRTYAESIPDEIDKLRNVTEQTLPAYAIDVHTIKGASAGIGAKTLSEAAKRLEMMAKEGDLQGVQSENESFIEAAETLVADINIWFAEN